MIFSSLVKEVKQSLRRFRIPGKTNWLYFNENGVICDAGTDEPSILFWDEYSSENWEIKKEKVKKFFWINIYKGDSGLFHTGPQLYDNVETAIKKRGVYATHTVKVEIEVEE